ncbi:ribonuclease domain-containing protein [Gordonia sp. VNQ95]|uniref:ribonuclease domain-containing protein n=1 Tax=Gordonia sp. VNQ95 TaxID=3156619 RepID=UPI0032B4F8A1
MNATSKRPRSSARGSRTQTPAQRRRQAVVTAIGLVVVAVVVIATWLINNAGDDAGSSGSSVAGSSVARSSVARSSVAASGRSTSRQTATVPARVTRTLALIDAGEWPEAADAPGTQGGITFRNSEGRLPARDSAGKRITYREWDVNPKEPGRSRDAERIVTGSDGSAWYTADHYRSFVLIRGPS